MFTSSFFLGYGCAFALNARIGRYDLNYALDGRVLWDGRSNDLLLGNDLQLGNDLLLGICRLVSRTCRGEVCRIFQAYLAFLVGLNGLRCLSYQTCHYSASTDQVQYPDTYPPVPLSTFQTLNYSSGTCLGTWH